MSEIPHYDGQKLSILEQKELLKRLENGDNPSVLASEFGISRRMVNLYRSRFKLEARARGKPPHKYKFKGKTLSLKEWSEETGIPYHTLRGRVSRDWTVKEMLSNPQGQLRPQHKKKPLLPDETMLEVWLDQQGGASLRDLAEKYGVSQSNLAHRLQDVRGVKGNYRWDADDPRKPSQLLVASLMAFLRKKRLLTQFKKFHLEAKRNA